MERKLFTLEEANAMLPQVKAELANLQELVERIEEGYADLQRLRIARAVSSAAGKAGEDDPDFERESRLEFMRMEADMLMGNFARQGIQLKLLRPGLVDFPSVLDGEEILICWKEGEERITHYHGLHDGFAGRQKFPE